jgi:hypothetical protein
VLLAEIGIPVVKAISIRELRMELAEILREMA